MKEVGSLLRHSNKITLTCPDIQKAVRFVVPGELFRHALSEGTKAVTKFMFENAEATAAKSKAK